MPATTQECQRILGVDTQLYNQNMCMSGRFPMLAIYVNIFNVSTYARLYVNIHVYVYLYVCRYVYIYIYLYIYTYIYIHIYIYIYTYIYIHIYSIHLCI